MKLRSNACAPAWNAFLAEFHRRNIEHQNQVHILIKFNNNHYGRTNDCATQNLFAELRPILITWQLEAIRPSKRSINKANWSLILDWSEVFEIESRAGHARSPALKHKSATWAEKREKTKSATEKTLVNTFVRTHRRVVANNAKIWILKKRARLGNEILGSLAECNYCAFRWSWIDRGFCYWFLGVWSKLNGDSHHQFEGFSITSFNLSSSHIWRQPHALGPKTGGDDHFTSPDGVERALRGNRATSIRHSAASPVRQSCPSVGNCHLTRFSPKMHKSAGWHKPNINHGNSFRSHLIEFIPFFPSIRSPLWFAIRHSTCWYFA